MPALILCVNQIAGIFLGKIEIDVINATSRISQSIIHADIYWLTENVTTCMVIFHIGIYGIIYSTSGLAEPV